jgi:hypothetical protein
LVKVQTGIAAFFDRFKSPHSNLAWIMREG